MGNRPIIVIGHKNPDTDSICAALAYARLKRLRGELAQAYRAGNVNAQTKFALSYFDVEPPHFIADVFPRISDIMIGAGELIVLRPEEPLGRARDIMLERRFSFLPVADASDRCIGKITLLGLTSTLDRLPLLAAGGAAEFYVDELVRRCRGRLVDSRWSGRLFRGSILSPLLSDSFGERTEGQPDLPRCILLPPGGAQGAVPRVRNGDFVIACGEDARHDADATISLRLPTSLIESLTNLLLASPVSSCIDTTGPSFAPHDLVRNVERQINRYNEGGFIVTDEEGVIHGVITRVSFLARTQFPLILVDHNELSQAVDGAEHADIIEVIDHHRLGTRGTDLPITFINRVVGSTCTIVADLYRVEGREVDRPTAGIMLAAVLSDTVILKSPTTTNLDREIAAWLASRAGVEIDEFGEEMFAAGSELRGREPQAIVRQDQKTYAESGFKFSVSQIETIGFKSFHEIRFELAHALEALRSELGCNFACLLVTDITRGTSLLLFAGDRRVHGAIGYPSVAPELFELEGVLSRKKQVLPYFLDLLKNL